MLGSKVNVKPTNVKDEQRGRVLHGIFGLSQYPNYLYRYELEEISSLEKALQEKLLVLRKQKSELEQLTSIKTHFSVHASEEFVVDFGTEIGYFLSQHILSCLQLEKEMTVHAMMSYKPPVSVIYNLADLITEEASGTYCVQSFFKPSACSGIISRSKLFSKMINDKLQLCVEESDRVALLELSTRPPPLRFMGLAVLEDVLLWVLSLLAPLYYPEYIKDGPLDWKSGYIVGYSANTADVGMSTQRLAIQRSALDAHTDDSEITINAALSSDFEGGELVFRFAALQPPLLQIVYWSVLQILYCNLCLHFTPNLVYI